MTLDERETLLGNLGRAIHPVRPPNPLVLAWRWRYELAATAGVLFAVPWIVGLPTEVVLGIAALPLLVAGIGPLRRLAWRRLRAIVLQHRLRTAFVQARLHSAYGRIPTILWTSPRQHVDRVLLFLPAGLSERLLRSEADRIAVACDGLHAEVFGVGGHRVLVWLVVARA
jgi:hypothetical protein